MNKIILFLLNNPCEDPNVLNVILYIRKILEVAFVVIPIVLIILMTVDFIKNVISGNEDNMKKNQKIIVKRLVYVIMLFFVMPIVNIAFSAFGTSDNEEKITHEINEKKVNYLSCWDNGKSKETINKFIITAKFEENGGKVYGDNVKTCGGSKSCEISVPRAHKKNSKFLGWSTKEECEEDVEYKQKIKIKKNKNENTTTFYACYEENEKEELPEEGTIGSNSTATEKDEGDSTPVTKDEENEQKHYIFVGDSRMCGILQSVKMLSEESVVCEVGKSLQWFKDTAIDKINSKIKSDTSKKYIIIINLGVNDPDNGSAKNYYTTYNKLKNGDWKKHDVVIASVDPVDENKYKTIKNYNNIIKKFNKDLKDNLNSDIKYCNTYDMVEELIKDSKNIEKDGLHYKAPTYNEIYKKLKECAK